MKPERPSLPVRGAWIEIICMDASTADTQSLPVRGAWIEIGTMNDPNADPGVATRAGRVD